MREEPFAVTILQQSKERRLMMKRGLHTNLLDNADGGHGSRKVLGPKLRVLMQLYVTT